MSFEQKFMAILQTAVQNKSSDIHLVTGQPPAIRGRDGLIPINVPAITADEMFNVS